MEFFRLSVGFNDSIAAACIVMHDSKRNTAYDCAPDQKKIASALCSWDLRPNLVVLFELSPRPNKCKSPAIVKVLEKALKVCTFCTNYFDCASTLET